MNIITKADVDKFILLLQAGLKQGRDRDLTNYASAVQYSGTNIAKEYYVKLEFSFRLDTEIMNEIFIDDDFDVGNKIADLLK